MITCKDWLFFLITAKSLTLLAVPSFSFHLDKKNIQLGESVFFQIEVPKSQTHTKPLVLDDSLQQQKEIKLLERNLRETPESWIVTYELTTHDLSPLRVPPIQIKSGADLFSTESQTVSVDTSRAEDDMEIRAEFSELKPPFPWRLLYLALIAFFSLVASLWFLSWVVRKIPWRRINDLQNFIPRFHFPRHRKWLRTRLAEIEEKIKGGSVNASLVDEVEQALRYFLFQKTSLPIRSWTSREIKCSSSHRLFSAPTLRILSDAEAFKYSSPQKANPHQVALHLIQEIRRVFRL